MTFAFGDHVLHVERRDLRRGDAPIALEPQVFDLLVYLIRNRARVVSKDDLIANIWGGRIVSECILDCPHQCGANRCWRQRGGTTNHSHDAAQGRSLRRRGARGKRGDGGAASRNCRQTVDRGPAVRQT